MNWVTILGLVAATFTTAAFVPQAVKIIRTKHTKDISIVMYSMLIVGIILWLIYGIMLGELPIILTNSVTLVFTAIIFGLKLKYK